MLLKYPMVTDVGSELGRQMTAPIPPASSTTNFMWDSSPTMIPRGKRARFTTRRSSPKISRSSFRRFPGIIFNYTQPAEDAVDEALTGLKSALAVKIYGPDLNVLQDRALEIKRRLSQVPGFTELTVVRELGQPSLIDRRGPRQNCAVRHQCGGRGSRRAGGRGGQAATQVIQGEKLFDLVVRMKPRISRERHANRQPAGGHADRAATPFERAGRTFTKRAALRSFIAKAIRATSACSTASKGATCRARWTTGSALSRISSDPSRGLPARMGRRVQRIPGSAAPDGNHRPAGGAADLHDPVSLYGNFKFPVTIALGVVMTEPVGALIALKLTHTPFSVSSVLGLARADGSVG